MSFGAWLDISAVTSKTSQTLLNQSPDLLSGYSNKKGNKAANRKLEQQKFHWGPEQQTAFELLKNKVSKDVVLAYRTLKRRFDSAAMQAEMALVQY